MTNSDKIRNVALIGTFGSGKTTLTESILYGIGAINAKGNVEKGDSVSDYDPDEIRKNLSLNSSLCQGQWKEYQLNFVDTPGHPNYLNDSRAVMNAVDMVVLVVDGIKGVDVTSQKLWMNAQERNIPRFIFINKLDSDQVNLEEVVEDLTSIRLFKNAKLLTKPIGKGESLSGLADLSQGKAYIWKDKSAANPKLEAVPDDVDISAEYEEFVESIAESDEELLEKYLEEGELSSDDMAAGLKKAFVNQDLALILCGSAKDGVGSQALIDAIIRFGPSPLDKGEITCYDALEEGKTWECKLQDEQLFCGQVFKTISDPYLGKISLFRVLSGSIKADENTYNVRLNKSGRFGKIFRLLGKKQSAVSELKVGDIGAVAKLKETQTGDTMLSAAASSNPFHVYPIKFPEPIYSVAITPKTKNDENKLGTCLHRLKEEDPFFQVSVNPISRKTVLGGMGQTHVDLIVQRLKSRFEVEVDTSPPQVPYRETITAKAEAQGKHKKQSGGSGQYGDVHLRLEPLERGSGFEFVSSIVGGVVPRNYWPAVEKGVKGLMEEGLTIKNPIVDVKVDLFFGSYHAVDSNDLSFQLAARLAFKNAFANARPTILEPILDLEITVPEESTGDIISDMSSRRGRPLGMERSGRLQVIKAQLPMAEALNYAPSLTSITRGQGRFTAEFSHYEEVPSHIQDELISAFKREQEES